MRIDDDGDGFVECAIEEIGWLGADDVGGGDCDDTPATTDDDGNIIDVGGTKTYPGTAENETDLITDGICVSDNDSDGYAPIEVGGLDCDDNDPNIWTFRRWIRSQCLLFGRRRRWLWRNTYRQSSFRKDS